MSAAAWNEADLRAVAGAVPDPELPMVTVADLGMLRELTVTADGEVDVSLTPTFLGCPAIAVIREGVAAALRARGVREVRVHTVLAPAWSPEAITPAGRAKLAAAGVAPPGAACSCPRCGSARTEQTASFGPTPCTELRRCTACREPFQSVKEL